MRWSGRVAVVVCSAVLLIGGSAHAASGDITLIAGGGIGERDGGVPALEIELVFPSQCVPGPDRVIYVPEQLRIWRIGADGIINKFVDGSSGSVAVDSAGRVYQATGATDRIVAILPDGTVRTIVELSDGSVPNSLALTPEALYFADDFGGGVTRVDLATGALSPVPEFGEVFNVAAGRDGTLYGSTGPTHTIIALAPDGQVRDIAGTGTAGFSGDGGPATAAELDRPTSLVVDADDTVFVIDLGNNRIRRIDAAGTITTIAGTGDAGSGGTGPDDGNGGPAAMAPLTGPQGLGLDELGNLCFTEVRAVRSIEAAAAPTPFVDVAVLPPPPTTTVPPTSAPPPTTTPLPVGDLPATGSDPIGLPVAVGLVVAGAAAVWIARSPRGSRSEP
jgi:sugar lactone lactonase YvrE